MHFHRQLKTTKRRPRGAASVWLRAWVGVLISRLKRLGPAEEGTIAQASLLAMMGCVLAIGLVGNVARVTHEKIEVQNSADAAAHSVALWHARSLNAVTATNHLMGELTALCALHEAIGGPELDLGEEIETDELRFLDKLLTAPPPSSIANSLFQPDSILIDYIQRNFCKEGKTTAGAALYDARFALKRWISQAFALKIVAELLVKSRIAPLVAVGQVLHFIGTAVLVKCASEWLMMEYAVEPLAKAMKRPKLILQDAVIPLLYEYQMLIAKDLPAANTGLIENCIQDTIKRLDRENAVTSGYFRERLPIQKEAGPSGGLSGEVLSQSIRTEIHPAARALEDAVDVMAEVVDAINDAIKLLGITKISIPDMATPPESTPEVSDHNPTIKKYEAFSTDWNAEEKSQWTRATYPWVHSGRAKLLHLFNQPASLTFSRMPTYFGHWTTRMALIKSYELRSGNRMDGESQPALSMQVLREFDANKKGQERWTTQEGSRGAEELFTQLGFSRRTVEPLISPTIFGAMRHEQIAFAQAICYNANGRMTYGGQPVGGWDTLNWAPGQGEIPEYDAKPYEANQSDVRDLFDALVGREFDAPPEIRLNWQPKLVPLTESRVRDALDSGQVSGEFKESMSKTAKALRALNTH